MSLNRPKSITGTISEQFSRQKTRKKPKYVTRKNDEWIVRRCFPTAKRDKKGRVVYVQLTEPWEPQTEERAKELSDLLEQQHRQFYAKQRTPESLNRLGQVCERVLAAKKKALAIRTHAFYRKLYQRAVEGRPIALRPVSEITTLELQDFYDGLGDTERTESPLSADHIRKLDTFLSMVFAQAIRWNLLDKDASKGLILPKSASAETAAFSEQEAAALMQTCLAHDRFIKFALGLDTGLRPQELMALPLSNLDLVRRRVKVTRALQDDLPGGGFELGDLKTEASERTVRFNEALVEPLTRYLENRQKWIDSLRQKLRRPVLLKHMKRKGANYNKRKRHHRHIREILENIAKYDLVFPSSTGTPQSIRNTNQRDFQDALTLAKIKDRDRFTLSSLRHTNLTLLAEKISPKRLQKHAGHARITTTLNYYVHVNDDGQDELPDKIGDVLYGTRLAA